MTNKKMNKSIRQKRRQADKRGKRAELIAAMWLILKGYRIKRWRYKTDVGEVDIIARKKDVVAFVEVKARPDVRDALDDISIESQRRIENAAQNWLQKQSDFGELSWRFDVVAITPRKITHFQNVW